MKHLVLWAILSPLVAFSQVHKCQIDGRTSYTEAPCPAGTGSAVVIRENTLDTSGQRSQGAKIPKVQETSRPKGGAPGPCDHLKWRGAAPTPRESELMSACMKKAAKDYRRP